MRFPADWKKNDLTDLRVDRIPFMNDLASILALRCHVPRGRDHHIKDAGIVQHNGAVYRRRVRECKSGAQPPAPSGASGPIDLTSVVASIVFLDVSLKADI